jgi:hypothetical protein
MSLYEKLFRYGPTRWLYSKNPNGVLVLLSHLTEPPDAFNLSSYPQTGPQRFLIPIRSTCYWTAVYAWLSNWIPSADGREDRFSLLRDLIGEFVDFLKEEKMAPNPLKDPDIPL